MGRKKKIVPVEENIGIDSKLGVSILTAIANTAWSGGPPPQEVEVKEDPPPQVRVNTVKRVRKEEVNQEVQKPVSQEKREAIDPFDYIKLPVGVSKDNFKIFLPSKNIFRNNREEKSFYNMINSYLVGFDFDELSASDIEDVISLVKNTVLEERLLIAVNKADEKGNADPRGLLDISATIEKLRKHSTTIKGNLSNRRVDRIDPKNKQNFSIADIVFAYDEKMKQDFKKRIDDLEKENKEYLDKKSKREGTE